MAEPLKDQISRAVIAAVGERFGAADPAFDTDSFTARATRGLEKLELKLVMRSTRQLFAGRHRVALKLNGVEVADASFVLELN